MISIKGLTKSFGKVHVMDNLDLEIPAGRATGIVGPNGSGKTTLIKQILGLVRPDGGTMIVNGTRLNGESSYRHEIGYMPQVAHYPENMKVRELLEFIREIRNSEATLDAGLIELFELKKELDKPLRTLSRGNLQKVGAVLAFMFDSPIIILDEPTAGLDPKSSVRLKKWILEEKKKGKTVILTSHIMSEVEELADYLVFLVEGRIRYRGSMEELIGRNNHERLENIVAEMMEQSGEAVA